MNLDNSPGPDMNLILAMNITDIIQAAPVLIVIFGIIMLFLAMILMPFAVFSIRSKQNEIIKHLKIIANKR